MIPGAAAGTAPAPPGLRVLLLEDTLRDALRLEQVLHEGGLRFTLRRIDTIDALRRALAVSTPDIVLVDYAWRAEEAIAAVLTVRDRYPDVAVVVVTDPLEDDAAVAVMKAGANACVRKDRLARLPAAVRDALAESTR